MFVTSKLDDRLAERKDVGKGRARLAGGENEDSAVVRPSSSSRSDRIIPSETWPRSLARSSFVPPGSTAPGSATATVAPVAEVPGTAHDLTGSPFAHVHAAELEPVGVRVLTRLEHVADAVEPEVPVDVGDTDPLDHSPPRPMETSMRETSSSSGSSVGTYSL